MKKIVLIVALTLTSPFVLATEDKISKHCPGVAAIAKSVMEARQENVPMARMMEVSDTELLREMVVAAYDRPAYRTENVKARAIRDFENEWYLNCVKAFSK